jgi:hypothetical protein
MSDAPPERGSIRGGIYPEKADLGVQLDQTISLLANRRRGFVHLDATENPWLQLMICIWLGKPVLAEDRISDRHKQNCTLILPGCSTNKVNRGRRF